MVAHRPYPAPSGSFIMHQRWHDLLFMHWRVPADVLRPLIPQSLAIDTFDGSAWIAVVPFRMSGVRPRGLPSAPWLSAFPELNVRTYVSRDGRPGVWFFSLDAANSLAVLIARAWFSLPYFHAHMRLIPRGENARYISTRTHPGAPPAQLTCEYGPAGAAFEAVPGTLEYFLTARYCLYTARQGRLLRGEIDHPAWPLQPAACDVQVNSMTRGLDIPLAGAPHLLFARDLDVQVWPLQDIAGIG